MESLLRRIIITYSLLHCPCFIESLLDSHYYTEPYVPCYNRTIGY